MLSSILFSLLPLVSVLAAPTAKELHEAVMAKRATQQVIRSNRNGLCISPSGGRQAVNEGKVFVGSPLVSMDCDKAALWDISPGSGSVILSGTSLALDAGIDPHNFVQMKVWTSYPGLTQQTWYLTGDKRIAITGGTMCLDMGDNGYVQTYTCTTGNTNQIWFVEQGSQPNIYPDPSPTARRIHPNGRADLCVTVMNANPIQAQQVAITDCFANDAPFSSYQFWNITTDLNGPLKLTNFDFCLLGSTSPTNGNIANLDPCGVPYVNLNWQFTNGRLVTGNNQCLDVQLGSVPGNQSPYPSVQTLQTWQCFPGNTQQQFFLYGYPA